MDNRVECKRWRDGLFETQVRESSFTAIISAVCRKKLFDIMEDTCEMREECFERENDIRRRSRYARIKDQARSFNRRKNRKEKHTMILQSHGFSTDLQECSEVKRN